MKSGVALLHLSVVTRLDLLGGLLSSLTSITSKVLYLMTPEDWAGPRVFGGLDRFQLWRPRRK